MSATQRELTVIIVGLATCLVSRSDKSAGSKRVNLGVSRQII